MNLTVEIEGCPPGINSTYGVKSKGLYKTDQATAWQRGAALAIGAAAGRQCWEDNSKYYAIKIFFEHPRLDVDAPVKLVIDTVAQKLGFNDGRIIEQSSKKFIGDNQRTIIILNSFEELKLSFSRVDMYSLCTELWYQRYILHKTTPPSPDAFYGTIVHGALTSYWEGGFEKADQILEESDYNLFDKPKTQEVIAKKLLREGIKSLTELGIKSDGFRCISPELHLDFPDFQGYLDLSIDDQIIDWKIVNSNYAPHKLLSSEQLTCYAWLYYRQFNELPKRVSYVNLNKHTF